MSRSIDLNVDLGEGFPFDAELLRYATSANICCGAHAGSFDLSLETVEICRLHQVRIGAHPGYPDRGSMGRKPMAADETREYLNSIFEQTKRFVQAASPAYIKPHGAFYNDTAIVLPNGWNFPKIGMPPYDAGGLYLAQTPGLQSLGMLLRVHKLPLMGLSVTAHAEVAKRAGQPLIREAFADRRLREDGTLVPRTEPGAVLHDPLEIAAQVLRIAPTADSICLHGDTEGCVEFAEMIVRTLTDAGYTIHA